MSDIRKILDVLNETSAGASSAGAVASVAQPLGEIKRRQSDDSSEQQTAPKVIEYGNWENSAMTTGTRLKNKRTSDKKISKSIYGENKKTSKKKISESPDGTAQGTHMFLENSELQNYVAQAIIRRVHAMADSRDFQNVAYEVAEMFKDGDEIGSSDISIAMARAIASYLTQRGHQLRESEEIVEQDLIISPASMSKKFRDLISKDHDRTDHEVEMARSDLFQAGKNAAQVLRLIQNVEEEQGLEGWVQEKIIKASDYLNTVREYLEGKHVQSVAEDTDIDQQAQAIAAKLTTDKNLEKLRAMAHDSTVYRALDRYFAKHDIPETIYNRVANIVFKKINKQDVAEGSVGDDHGDYHSTAKAANQASRTAKSRQDHANAADLHSRAATYGLSADQDQSVIRDHQMTAREHDCASKGLKEQGVAEDLVNEGQYEMMLRNGQVKKFVAKDDADAKRIAKGHNAKSLIRLKKGISGDKILEQEVFEKSKKKRSSKKKSQRSIRFIGGWWGGWPGDSSEGDAGVEESDNSDDSLEQQLKVYRERLAGLFAEKKKNLKKFQEQGMNFQDAFSAAEKIYGVGYSKLLDDMPQAHKAHVDEFQKEMWAKNKWERDPKSGRSAVD